MSESIKGADFICRGVTKVAIELNPTARRTMHSVNALHVRCQRGDDGKLKGLSFEAETGFYHSGWWDLSDDDAQALLGGWLYLHPPTSIKSELGGRIRDFSRAQIGSLPKGLLTFVFDFSPAARNADWRGRSFTDTRNRTGGLVPADLLHEEP